ncbi:hypothetical protein WN943_015922 [Citrus x changshan-huyou]
MASSSSCGNYEVFLNFRGEDTRKSFTCYLYDKLYEGKKIKTFIDDEGLRRGDEISPALLNAIQGSKISVVIFSKDYASSKCPSDVRHQNGTFGDRFDELKKQFKDKPEMVQKWRDALTETSHLAGHESTKFRLDAQLVNKIVEDVLKKLEKITVSTDSSNGLVGLNSRIEQIKPFLCMDLWDTVQIVGIWGMGGIGKTTLAEAIFDQFSGEFDGKYFAKDVRRKSETEGGLEDLQKEMLSTILSEKLEVAGPNIPQFTKGRLRRMKVLIVLDDVNKDEQLEGLIGGLDQYGPGSRIVVTTRDKRVLKKFGVEKIYRVNGLKFDEAFEHFCNFAVKESHCPEDLNWHSWRVVEYAKGNPLVLKVLGSSLYLKRKSHWENVLDDLNRICESDIHNIYEILKISYNELIPRVKSMFLDIACFLEGEDKDFVLRILDDSGSHRLDVLVDKSLITVSDNCLQMHDLLQEMGQETVRQESEEEPGRRSRLWDPKEIRRVLKHNMGNSHSFSAIRFVLFVFVFPSSSFSYSPFRFLVFLFPPKSGSFWHSRRHGHRQRGSRHAHPSLNSRTVTVITASARLREELYQELGSKLGPDKSCLDEKGATLLVIIDPKLSSKSYTEKLMALHASHYNAVRAIGSGQLVVANLAKFKKKDHRANATNFFIIVASIVEVSSLEAVYANTFSLLKYRKLKN